MFEELGYDLAASLDFTLQQGWNRLGSGQAARSTRELAAANGDNRELPIATRLPRQTDG